MSISMNVKQKLNATNMRNVSTNRDISTVNANMMRATTEMELIVTVSVLSYVLFHQPRLNVP